MSTPDIEYAVREWLRLDPVVGPHAYFGVPDSVPDSFVTLGLVGGGFTPGTTPLCEARLSLSAWGLTKKTAGDLARHLLDLFVETEETDIGNGVHLYGGAVDLYLWRPATDTGRPRYLVDITAHFRATD